MLPVSQICSATFFKPPITKEPVQVQNGSPLSSPKESMIARLKSDADLCTLGGATSRPKVKCVC